MVILTRIMVRLGGIWGHWGYMGSDGVYGVRGAAQAELSAAVLRRDLSLERAPVVGVRVQRLPYRGCRVRVRITWFG